MKSIAFIGLGHMGLPMASNLIKAGFSVYGYDLQPAALDAFHAAGGQIAKTAAEAGAGKDVLITMLQTADQVKSVCSGAEGLFSQAKAGALYIDCSSIDVEGSRDIHKLAAEYQLFSLDAPVSGGTAGAEAATLTFMVGGSEVSYNKAQAILQAMGKNIIYTGEAGSGAAAKICNNMILGISMIAVSEAFLLAEKLGLSDEKLFEVVNQSSGQCWAMSKYPPRAGLLDNVPANRNYAPGFTVDMMLKDLNLSQSSASSVNLNTLLGAKAQAIYQQFQQEGYGGLDFSAIIQAIE